ncbi:MAG: ATP-binding protein, partial [Cyclobacteriaceae bacterium]|nr:ATP-binding protein [Cyclobacteriaceae bacterium]
HEQGLGTLYPSGKLEWAHPGYAVTSIFVDRNEVFVGTSFGTIYRYSNKAFSLVSILPRSVVRDIKVFSNGDVAVAGNKGLFIVPDTIAITPVATDIRYTNTYCIYENPDGVWLGTEAGLAEIKDDEIAKWAVEGLSIDKPVYSILKTREGHLWFGTSDGAYYYDGISLKHFSEKDGLFGTDVSRNGLIQTSDGKIWIGTDKGISIYDPQGDISLKSIFDLKLLYAGGDDFSCLSTDTAMRVQHHNNDLEFKFRALSFYDESKINYRYRLVGFDDEWNYEENPEDNKVLYRHLPYGSFFQFEVQARLEEGPWTASVLSGHVLIKAPYYLQWWFIVAVALFFGAIGYLIRRVIGQAAYSKRLEGEVFEKTKEISRTYKTIQEQNIALKESEKRLENDLEQRKLYEVKLEQSNLELSTFFYRASHDLKGPLSSFRGLLYLSENKNNINDFDQFMRLMRKSLNHLDNILDNFITVGYIKESSIKSEPIDFEETIKVLLDELSIFKAMKKLQIHYEVNVFDTCYLDSRLIKAIFRNLIHNIIKYQKEGGSNLDITIHKSKQGLNIVFSDTGIGIPSAYHEKVFEMFFRASTLEKGSGLGLYIVKSSVEKLGGTLMMESEEGIGTSFKIFFPREGFQERKTKGLFTVPSGV